MSNDRQKTAIQEQIDWMEEKIQYHNRQEIDCHKSKDYEGMARQRGFTNAYTIMRDKLTLIRDTTEKEQWLQAYVLGIQSDLEGWTLDDAAEMREYAEQAYDQKFGNHE